ncbi:hypothetical protein DFH06DRAFT_1344194 [Mycena polygramma]|nr:hypothetical protein DFH06DRAFT_1344194 [Mycena polygramma]
MEAGSSDDGMIDVDGGFQYAPDDINGMIMAAKAEGSLASAAANKFLVRTPASMAKAMKRKAEPSATKPNSKKKKTGEDSDEEPVKKAKGKKKKTDGSDTDEPPSTITYYIFIPKLPPVTATKKRASGSKSADDDAIQKGPFSLPTSASYPALLSAIAEALPCRKEHVNESKILWKPKKPKNADKLSLGKATGYKVMVEEMKGKAPGTRQVLLYMPPPAKPMDDDTPWETDGDPQPTFDYNELEPALPSDSVYAQKENFNKATKEERQKLEDQYPIGNYPEFPDLRVYQDPRTKFYFELNTTRLGVWASAMAQGQTDEKTPPASKFFDANKKLTVKNIPAAIPVVAPAPAVTAPIAPNPAGLSLSELLLATLLSQGGGLAALLPQLNPAPAVLAPAPAPPTPAPAPPAPVTQPRSVPPSPVKRHAVSVDRFAEIYNLESGDVALCKEVGFRPGDPTEATLHDELKKVGFTFFSWTRVHTANVQFKKDLAAGSYD